MGPDRFPRFGLAVAPHEWLRSRDEEAGGSPGSTTPRFRYFPVPRIRAAVDDRVATGTASPRGDPGCTVHGPIVETYRFDDGSVVEVID